MSVQPLQLTVAVLLVASNFSGLFPSNFFAGVIMILLSAHSSHHGGSIRMGPSSHLSQAHVDVFFLTRQSALYESSHSHW